MWVCGSRVDLIVAIVIIMTTFNVHVVINTLYVVTYLRYYVWVKGIGGIKIIYAIT